MAAEAFSRSAVLRLKASSIGARKASHSFCSWRRSSGTLCASACQRCCSALTASMRSIGCSAQLGGLGDHGLAPLDAGLLRRFERRTRGAEGLVPLRLQFGEHFFAHMAGIAPAVGELMQRAVVRLQVGRIGMLRGPGLHFFDQREALRAVLGGIGADLFEPGLDHLVRLVAGFVEALPQRVVRHAALVGLLPLVAQRCAGSPASCGRPGPGPRGA